MAQMGLSSWSYKHDSSTTTTTTTTTTASAAITSARRQRGDSSGCLCLGRLMRKLKKRSKLLCMAARPSSSSSARFDFHYDPLSYSRNFDCSGRDGDDDGGESQLLYSRFVAVAKDPLAKGNITR